MGTQPEAGRMLLSHNYTLGGTALAGSVPFLSKDEFVSVFASALSDSSASVLEVSPLAHTHWQVEVRFDAARLSAADVGFRCARALQQFRSSQVAADAAYTVLALGGLKQTPPTSSNPTALQTGEWGVDMVETLEPDAFLSMIGWQRTVDSRPADTYFQHAVSVSA